MKTRCLLLIAVLGLALACLSLQACGDSRESYAGTYRSVEPFAGKGHIELVLKENGEASWKLAEEGKTIKFKWKVDDNRLWLYTKEGAIILVTVSDGGKKLSVDMTGEWNPTCPVNQCLLFEKVVKGGS